MSIQNAYHMLYLSVLVVLSILTLLCLVRAIQGPRIADRIVSINMISTLTITMICVLAVMQNQGFLAVGVLCKVYMGIALEKREKEKKEANGRA